MIVGYLRLLWGGFSLDFILCLLFDRARLEVLVSVTDRIGKVWHRKSSFPFSPFFLEIELDLIRSSKVLKMILGLGCDRDILGRQLLLYDYQTQSVNIKMKQKKKLWVGLGRPFLLIAFRDVPLINIINAMNNLELLTKFRRRTRNLVTQPDQKQHLHPSSQKKSPSPFSKVEKPFLYNTLDYSKILPKNMPYDKQSLYLENLSLKMELNQVMDENIRLKTKMVSLERQVSMGWSQKIYSSQKEMFTRLRRDKYDTIKSNQGLLVEGLKKMIKYTKKQAEILKKENLQFKKNMKISKDNELQLEVSTLLQQNKRISTIYEGIRIKSQETQARNQTLQKSQLNMKNQIKNLQKEIITLKSYIKAIELQQRIEGSSFNMKQRKIQQIGFQKRKQMQGAKHMQQLKKDFLINKQSSFRISKKQHLRTLKVHYNMPIRRQPIKIHTPKQDSHTKSLNNQQGLHIKNQTLQQENKKLMKSCQSLEMTLKSMQQRLRKLEKVNREEELPTKPEKQIPIKDQQKQQSIKHHDKQQPIKHNDQQQPINHQEKSPETVVVQQKIFQIPQKQKFETIQQSKIEYSSVQHQEIHDKTKNKDHIQNPRAFSQPQSKITKSKHVFKSNKRIIGQICQLLTYRMIAQRYSYNELKADIEQSPAKEFSYIDLCHMFVNEPFYLTVDYSRILLCFMLEKEKPAHSDTISSMTLIAKLRKVIKDYEPISQQQEQTIIQRCANTITQHSKQIRQSFNYSTNQNKTIRHDRLKEILLKLGLNEVQVKLIVSEMSICSNDLSHLNLDVLFQRFDLNQLSSVHNENNIIEQAQNDDSFMNSKHKEEGKIQEKIIKNKNSVGFQQKIHNQQGQNRPTRGKNNQGSILQA